MCYQVFCFDNGNTAVFDERGLQLTEVQAPWILAVADALGTAGHNPLDATITLPGGRKAQFFVTPSGLNWRFMR